MLMFLHLYFNKTVRSIAQMYNRITFQTVLIPIMINRTVQGICINAKVPDTHCLKKQSECIEVIYQIIRTQTKSSHTH